MVEDPNWVALSVVDIHPEPFLAALVVPGVEASLDVVVETVVEVLYADPFGDEEAQKDAAAYAEVEDLADRLGPPVLAYDVVEVALQALRDPVVVVDHLDEAAHAGVEVVREDSAAVDHVAVAALAFAYGPLDHLVVGLEDRADEAVPALAPYEADLGEDLVAGVDMDYAEKETVRDFATEAP